VEEGRVSLDFHMKNIGGASRRKALRTFVGVLVLEKSCERRKELS